MGELEDFLQSQVSLGSLAGSGVFTIDIARARQQMAAHLLREPSHFILRLIQAAVRSQAARIHLRGKHHQLELLWDQTLPTLNGWAQNHLEYGLVTFLHQPGCALRLESRSGEILAEEGQVDFPPDPQGWWSYRLCLQRPEGGSSWKRWLGKSDAFAKEKELLRQRCDLAPLPIFLEGLPINRWNGRVASPGPGGVATFPRLGAPGPAAYLLSSEQSPELLCVPRDPGQQQAIQKLREDLAEPEAALKSAPNSLIVHGNYPGVACWAYVHPHPRHWSEVLFVVDGVSTESERNVLDRPGYQAIIAGKGLSFDLNGEPVRNDRYFARLNEVKSLLRSLPSS